MLKHNADAFVVAFAVTSGDEDLYAYGKTHRQSGEDEVIQARHHGATQLVGTEVAKECGIGKSDDGLRKVTQHDGISNAPDFFVRNGGSYHAAKIVFYGICFAKKSIKNQLQNLSKIILLILNDFLPEGQSHHFEPSEKKALPKCSVMSEAIKASCPISSAARSPERP